MTIEDTAYIPIDDTAEMLSAANTSVVSLDAARKHQIILSSPCTDMGNGERFASRYGQRARYLPGDKAWYVWNGVKWKRDDSLQVKRFAKDTIRAITAAAMRLTNAEEKSRMAKHAHQSEATGRIENMLTCASAEPGMAVTVDEFDQHPFLLTCPNGTLDCSTRTLYPNQPGNLITRSTPTIYDPNATCPAWEKFLDEIFQQDGDLVSYMQRATGYSMTADMREDVIHICWGTGSNGKSTWGNTVGTVLGDYAESASVDTFLSEAFARSSNAPKEDLARLRGARFVRASEPDERRSLNTSLLKEITGREPITARFLFGATFKFRPVFKLWISANHKPPIHDSSHGMWRRTRLVPFTVEIADAQQDKSLEDRLAAEASGILNWALDGIREWLDYGLNPPPAILAATEQYRTDSDLLGLFIRDVCRVEDWRTVDAAHLYKVYSEWCVRTGERAWANNAFHRKLTDRGFPIDHTTGMRTGIGLRDDYNQGRA
jgi:putative DNA primase/helicase